MRVRILQNVPLNIWCYEARFTFMRAKLLIPFTAYVEFPSKSGNRRYKGILNIIRSSYNTIKNF